MLFANRWDKTVFAILCLTLVSFLSLAQEPVRFTAFGHHPNDIPDSLYLKLSQTDLPKVRAELFFMIGQIHLEKGNTDSIIHYGNQLKKVSETLQPYSISYKAKALLMIGKGQLKKGLFDEAMKAFIEGLNGLNGKKKDTIAQELYLGLAQTYFYKGNQREAKSILEELQSSEIPEISIASTYHLAALTNEQGNYDQARLLFQKVKERSKSKDLNRLELASSLQIGQLFVLEGSNKKAFVEFEKVLQDALEFKFYDLYTEAAMLYGQLSTELKQYQSAEMVLAMAYTNSINWDNLELQRKIINSLRKIYQAKGDFENAYNLMTQYVSVTESITKNQNTKAIQDLEVRYRTLQKENEILELEEEKLRSEAEVVRQKTVKKAFLIGFLVVLIPVVALLFVYYQKLQAQSKLNEKHNELNEQRIKSLKSKQELELAKASLNAQTEERSRIAKQLHDGIGGNLAGIKLQLSNLDNNPGIEKEIMAQVNETYELVREISHNLTPSMFMTSEFSSLLEQYSDKINSTINTSFSLFVHPKKKWNHISDRLKVEVYQIIQELTTNALKHAKASEIELHLNIHGNMIQLLFEDNGVGFDTSKSSKGIGLKNIQQRLQELNASMILDSALKRGTAVTIEIPLKT